jgi:hypothetical protein
MNTISNFNKKPLIIIITGYLLSCLGIIMLAMGGLFVAAILIGIGINLLHLEGCEINLDNNTFRKAKSLFGYKFGKWNPLPKIEYISVFKTKENKRINGVSSTTVVSENIVLVNLFYLGNKNITAYKSIDKEEAFKVAKKLALKLNIKILDVTEREQKWI